MFKSESDLFLSIFMTSLSKIQGLYKPGLFHSGVWYKCSMTWGFLRIFFNAVFFLTVASQLGCSYALQEVGVYKSSDRGPSLSKSAANSKDSSLNSGFLNLDFATVKLEVLEKKCLACHSAAAGNKGHINLETYGALIKNLSEVKADIEDGSMPRGDDQLTALEKKIILTWIASGAPEHKSASGTPVAEGAGSLDKPSESAEELTPLIIYESAAMKEFAARGKYLFQLSSCLSCHTVDSKKPLAGGKAMQSPYGTFYSPNISSDIKTGIGAWSAADFLRALREGVSPSKHYYYPAFPFTNYSKLSDEDILSIRAYIMSLKPIENPNRPHEIQFPFNQRFLLSLWRPLFFPKISRQNFLNYKLAQGPFQNIADHDLEWNRGAYLVEGALHCTVCHTPRNSSGGLIAKQWMAGARFSADSVYAPNITSDRGSGLYAWTASNWDHFLATGQKPNGEWTGGEMKKLVRSATAKLTPVDKSAVIHYLMSLEPVRSKVK